MMHLSTSSIDAACSVEETKEAVIDNSSCLDLQTRGIHLQLWCGYVAARFEWRGSD